MALGASSTVYVTNTIARSLSSTVEFECSAESNESGALTPNELFSKSAALAALAQPRTSNTRRGTRDYKAMSNAVRFIGIDLSARSGPVSVNSKVLSGTTPDDSSRTQ